MIKGPTKLLSDTVDLNKSIMIIGKIEDTKHKLQRGEAEMKNAKSKVKKC